MVVCSCIQASEGVSVAKYVEFWLHFIGVRSITAMTVEHTWDGYYGDALLNPLIEKARIKRIALWGLSKVSP